MFLKKLNFFQKLDSRTCSLKPAQHLKMKGLPWCLPPSLTLKACLYKPKIEIRLHVDTLTCMSQPCNYLTSLRHTVCSHLENLTHQKWRWQHIDTVFFLASTDPTSSIRIIHVQRKRKRGESIPNQLDASIPSGSRRRLRCVDRCGTSGHATFRADLPWWNRRRIHRWHRRLRRKVRSGETCVQHLKSKADHRSIFASILSLADFWVDFFFGTKIELEIWRRYYWLDKMDQFSKLKL